MAFMTPIMKQNFSVYSSNTPINQSQGNRSRKTSETQCVSESSATGRIPKNLSFAGFAPGQRQRKISQQERVNIRSSTSSHEVNVSSSAPPPMQYLVPPVDPAIEQIIRMNINNAPNPAFSSPQRRSLKKSHPPPVKGSTVKHSYSSPQVTSSSPVPEPLHNSKKSLSSISSDSDDAIRFSNNKWFSRLRKTLGGLFSESRKRHMQGKTSTSTTN